jgi:hypothetical protein
LDLLPFWLDLVFFSFHSAHNVGSLDTNQPATMDGTFNWEVFH